MGAFNVTTEAEFQALMNDVDHKLSDQKVPIPARPIKGAMEVSTRYGLGLTILPVAERQPTVGCYTGEDLVIRIYAWFDHRYGDRLNMHFPGFRSVVLIRGQPFKVNLPLIYGPVVRFVADPGHHGEQYYPVETINGQVATVNVLDAIAGLEPAYSRVLSEGELQKMCGDVHLASLQVQTIAKLFRIGKGAQAASDIDASVERLFDQPPQYGLSRWHSLQAAEKLIKVYLDDKRASYKLGRDGHNLNKLIDRAAAVQNSIGDPKAHRLAGMKGLVKYVQCDPALRYGEGSATVEEAVLAVKMAQMMGWHVAKAMGY